MRIAPRHRPFLAGVIVYVLLYSIASVRYWDDGFLSPDVFLNFLVDNSFLGIIAVGMTFVILSGGIDLSVGAVMDLAAIVIGVLIMYQHFSAAVAIPCGVLLGGLLGLGMGCLIQYGEMKPFIVTLAGLFFARGLGFIIHYESIAIDDPVHAWIASLSLPLPFTNGLSITALVFLGVLLLAAWIARFTAFGRTVHAIGGNEEAAVLMGLPAARTKVAVYTISGLSAGLAGAVLTLYSSSGNHIDGIGLELDAITAVVIGGTLLTGGVGSIFGTLIGVLTIGLILSVITTYEATFSSGLTKVAIGVLLLVFVVIQRVIARGGDELKPLGSLRP